MIRYSTASNQKLKKILRKNQNGFRRNRSTIQILTINRILGGVWQKKFETTLLVVDFTKASDAINRGKMKKIHLAYDLSKNCHGDNDAL